MGERKGFITLQDFDPESHALVENFREFVIKHFGNFARFYYILDTNRDGCVSQDEFAAFLSKVKWYGDPVKLFKLLSQSTVGKTVSPDPRKSPYVTLTDILPRVNERALLTAKGPAKTLVAQGLWESEHASLLSPFGLHQMFKF